VDLALTKFDVPPVTAPVVVLIGAPGAGKTTIGAALAQHLRIPFFDTDQVIQASTGLSVATIFSDYGEPAFRQLETRLLDHLIAGKMISTSPAPGGGGETERVGLQARTIVATGAGLAVQPGNFEKLEKLGTIICLTAPIEILAERLASSEIRPLVGTPNYAEQIDASQKYTGNIARLRALMAARSAIYARAQTQINSENVSVQEIVARILQTLSALQ
jgi:shikimate kinase